MTPKIFSYLQGRKNGRETVGRAVPLSRSSFFPRPGSLFCQIRSCSLPPRSRPNQVWPLLQRRERIVSRETITKKATVHSIVSSSSPPPPTQPSRLFDPKLHETKARIIIRAAAEPLSKRIEPRSSIVTADPNSTEEPTRPKPSRQPTQTDRSGMSAKGRKPDVVQPRSEGRS